MNENRQIPVHFETEDFNYGFQHFPDQFDEFALPSVRNQDDDRDPFNRGLRNPPDQFDEFGLPPARSQDDDQDPVLNEDLDNIFQQLVPVFHSFSFSTADTEASRLIPEELRSHSDFLAISAEGFFPGPTHEGLEGAFEPQINLDTMQILPFAQDLSQFAVVLELLDIQTADLERRLQYRRVIKETIERRKLEMEQWKHRIDMEINVSRHQERQLYGLLENKLEGIRAHCRARMQEYRNGPVQSRAILDNLPMKYSIELIKLKKRVQQIETTLEIQDQRVQRQKVLLDRKYEERQQRHGKKKCLYYYEACFMREFKRKFELEKDLRDAFVEFIREVKPRDEEENVLRIEPVMREIYVRGDTLMEMMHWVELRPFQMNAKVGTVLGNPAPITIALTLDRFLVMYRMDMATREFTFEKQIKVGAVQLRKDGQNLIVKEVKNRILWNREIEFSVDLGGQAEINEFINDFRQYY